MPPNERGLGVVFQDYAVWPHMSVADNVGYPLKLARVETAHFAASARCAAIAQVGLAGLEARLPSQLSGGQQQRVALARALVSEPRLLLLDEPLNNLDANLREEMRFEIKALQKKLGITILYVTHDQEIALGIADRLAVMDAAGRLRQIGDAGGDLRAARPTISCSASWASPTSCRCAATATRCGWAAAASAGPGPAPDRPGRFARRRLPPQRRAARAQLAAGLPGTVRRASFLGAQVDYLIDVAGTLVRAAHAQPRVRRARPAVRRGRDAAAIDLADRAVVRRRRGGRGGSR